MQTSKRWRIALLSVLGVLGVLGLISRRYIWLYVSRKPAPKPPVADLLVDPVACKDPQILLAEANRLAWVFNWPKAEPLYARAEELFKKRGDTGNEIYARVGLIRAQSETMSYLDVSEMIGKELENPVVERDPELKLWCLAEKGYTDLEINLASTKRDWTEAKSIAHSLGETQWEARAEGELGIIAFLEGDHRRAATMVGKALLSAMASGDAGAQIRYLEMLGNGFNEVRRYSEALAFFDRAIKVDSETPDAGFPYMSYEGKAQALVGQGKLEEARAVLRQALAVAKENEKFSHQSQILIEKGELALRSGDRATAVQFLEQGGRLGQEHAFFRMAAQAMLDLARIYRDAGDLKAAEQRAWIGLDASRRVGDRYFLPRDLTVLADVKALEGDSAAAEALYRQAEDVIDGMLVTVDEGYWNSSLAGAMSTTYLHHFELEVRLRKLERAFDVLERVRGRTAAAILENKISFRETDSPQAQELENKVSDLQLRLMRSEDAKERAGLLDQLVEYERKLEWTRSDQGVSKHEWFEKPPPLRAVQAVLRPDEAVLEYVLSDPHSYCLWITRWRVGLVVLPAGRQPIEELTRRHLAAMRAKRDDVGVAKKLYGILVAPVAKQVTSERLVVVPDGILHLLPFDVLRDSTGSLLLETRAISYVPASTVLWVLRSTKKTVSRRVFLGVGDVAYQDQAGVSAELEKPIGIEQRLLRGFSDMVGMPLYDLPQTRLEVLDVSKILGNDGVLLLGSNATETAFKSEPLADFKIIHLAVHGFADTRFPERSGLVLGVDPRSGDDGLLQVSEITRLRFNADLVTLSACDTGVGKLEGEEGITDLAGAFLESGAKAVVASLWSADDTYTLDLMVRFYTHIAEGQGKAEALRQAKLDLLQEYGKQVPPYYWGAFVLIGDGGSPIPLRVQ